LRPNEQQITYTDGAAYERTVGKWSQLAGEKFLEWLAPAPNLTWIDVGCGNGAFIELVVERCRRKGSSGLPPIYLTPWADRPLYLNSVR
jgi:hypothetical protein